MQIVTRIAAMTKANLLNNTLKKLKPNLLKVTFTICWGNMVNFFLQKYWLCQEKQSIIPRERVHSTWWRQIPSLHNFTYLPGATSIFFFLPFSTKKMSLLLSEASPPSLIKKLVSNHRASVVCHSFWGH